MRSLPTLLAAFLIVSDTPPAVADDFWCGAADMTGDGAIGISDFLQFAQCYSQPNPGTPAGGFLGFSTGTIDGSKGHLTMTGQCVGTFGAGAFMCPTTALAMQPPPEGITGKGWVQPVLAPTRNGDNSVIEVVAGFSPSPSQSISCNGWHGGSASGMTLSLFDPITNPESAGFTTWSCSLPLPVACCRLPELP